MDASKPYRANTASNSYLMAIANYSTTLSCPVLNIFLLQFLYLAIIISEIEVLL